MSSKIFLAEVLPICYKAHMDKTMTIKQACRALGIKGSDVKALAERLGTHRQTVEYWERERGGELPRWWVWMVERLAAQ